MDLIAISLIRKILKSRICEKIIANCEEWYRKVGSRICEIANCEDLELRGIPVFASEIYELIMFEIITAYRFWEILVTAGVEHLSKK